MGAWRRLRWACWSLVAVTTAGVLAGCSLAPKSFRAMEHPAAIKRARAVGYEETQPDWVAVPKLIEHLQDADPVVRMTSNDALKRRTGKDFGFVPWASPEERTPAVARWTAWWRSKMLANPLGKPRRKS